jgi:hypothetical protein
MRRNLLLGWTAANLLRELEKKFPHWLDLALLGFGLSPCGEGITETL